ncbi:unnamed protein product [Psylliodes chrysocephalus]|uniref:CCHC-type domain-containing protein n=1 Tax=Psylliodes chrysocephalus TaxID=3402493 RepID=A0A9P0G4G9_9CUCU|nr:unnamed protein product [Psylliodes chrysocephala]
MEISTQTNINIEDTKIQKHKEKEENSNKIEMEENSNKIEMEENSNKIEMGENSNITTNITEENGNRTPEDIEDNDNPFERRPSIHRTPTGLSRWLKNEENSLKQASKRARQETPPAGQVVKESSDILEKKQIMTRVTETSKELMALMRDTPKTKTEIKNIALSLNRSVESLQRRINEYEEEKTEPQVIKVKNLNSVGTQVNEEELKKENNKRKEEINTEILSTLETQTTIEKLKNIIDYDWPEEAYTKTKIIKGELADMTINEDVAFITNINGINTEEIGKKHPEAAQIIKEGLTEGQVEYIKRNIKIQSSKGDMGQTSNMNIIIPYKMDDTGITEVESLHDILIKLLRLLETENKNRIIISATGGLIDGDYLRKSLEYIFHKTEINALILVNKGIKKRKTTLVQRKENQTEKLIIKAEGKSYAELLKDVKGTVKLEETGIEVKTIKKTNRGDLFLEIQGNKEKAVALKEIIKTSNANTDVTIKTNDIILHITDIDASIGEQELKMELLNKRQELKEDDIKVLSIRPTQNGNQTATVAMKKEVAIDIANRGKIKIGWINCRVRQRVHMTRCFRCLQFGHTRKDCQEEDRSDLCLKCGKAGHKVKECENPPFCLTCRIEGHRQDQTSCPHYRNIIRERQRTLSTASSVFRR